MQLIENSHAPDFHLADATGKMHQLSDYKGKWLLLYFYPKDNTSGCTLEATGFRDDYAEYQKAGLIILGVSPQDEKSHTKFIQKYDLPFPLLVDADHRASEAYGVWGKKKLMGKEYMGVIRTSFLINPEGKIAKIYSQVKPAEHSKEVTADFNHLLAS